MTNLNELKQHLGAVEQTRQITNAMYLLSVSRMKQSMQHIEYNLEYMNRLRGAIRNIISAAKENEDVHNRYIEIKPEGKTLFVIITSDKGLCGGYNSNILNLAFEYIARCNDPKICILGATGKEILRSHGIEPDYALSRVSQEPSLNLARNVSEKVLSLYDEHGINEVYVVYTQYLSSVEQKATCKRILPLLRRDFQDVEKSFHNPVQPIYEPSVGKVFGDLVSQYLVGLLYDIMMQSAASENCARMAAMQSSVRNADEMIASLNAEINAARQLAITNEITEIAAASEMEGAV